jgi:hypothetical protein
MHHVSTVCSAVISESYLPLAESCVGIFSNKLYSCEGAGWSQSAIRSIKVTGTVLRLDSQFYNCLHMIVFLKLFCTIKHGNLFQNLTYCAACVRTRVVTNLVHVFQMEILFPLWWEHLVTHMALLLSLADIIYHFNGLHLLDMSGYVSPCLADWPTSLTTHQTRAATHMFAAPMLHQFPHWLNLKSTQLTLNPPLVCWWFWYWKFSTDCLVDWTLYTFHTLTYTWKQWFVCSVTCQHTNK